MTDLVIEQCDDVTIESGLTPFDAAFDRSLVFVVSFGILPFALVDVVRAGLLVMF